MWVLGVLALLALGGYGIYLAVVSAILWTVFAFGSVGFWILTGIAVVGLFTLQDLIERNPLSDAIFFPALIFVVYLALLQFFGKIGIVSFVFSHTAAILVGIAVYIVVAILWSVLKWYLFLRDRHEWMVEKKREFLVLRGLSGSDVPDDLVIDCKVYIQNGYDFSGGAIIPKAKDHKERIVAWMCYWPISMVWFFISDFVKRVFEKIFKFFQTMYQKMADKVFGDIKKELGY